MAAGALYQRAIELMPTESRAWRHVQAERAVVLGELGQFDVAATLREAAEAAARQAGDEALLARLVLAGVESRIQSDPTATMREALEGIEEAHADLERLGDEYGAIWALRLRGCFHAWLGNSHKACAIWTDALPRAERVSPRLTSELMIWLLWEAWWGPETAVEGIRRCDEYLDYAWRLGAKRLEAVALNMRAALKAYRGEFDEAHDDIRTGRGILRELGDPIWWAGASMVEADIEFTADDPQAAYDCLSEGSAGLAGLAATGYLATVVGLRAQAALQLEREDEALELADETERLSQPDDFEPLGRLRLVQALALARRGEVERADELMREAVAYIAETDYLVLVLELRFVEADIGRLLGRPEAERAGLERALAAAETKGNVVAATRARERLAKL